jgi:tRNA nucleotidyltransferase (CCA-adding enzyme)
MIDPGRADALRARRILARYGAELATDLLDHKEADLRGKGDAPPEQDLARLQRLRTALEHELDSPHRLRDLAVGGDDLIALGYPPGPPIGRALQTMLDEVVTDPSRNTREHLLGRAKEILA